MSIVYDTKDRIIQVVQSEASGDSRVIIILDNSDKYFSDKSFEGAKVELGFGFEDA